MTAYAITNTAGSTVATINAATTNTSASPLVLIGQGISLYGQTLNNDLYRLLEHWSNTTQPSNPVPGMIWYNSTKKLLNYYDGGQFLPLSGATSVSGNAYPMLSGAANIDMTVAATTNIFQAPNNGNIYFPTGILIIPVGTPSATTPVAFQLTNAIAGDMNGTTVIASYGANKYTFLPIEGTSRNVTNADIAKFTITTAASGGTFHASVQLFGYMTAVL